MTPSEHLGAMWVLEDVFTGREQKKVGPVSRWFYGFFHLILIVTVLTSAYIWRAYSPPEIAAWLSHSFCFLSDTFSYQTVSGQSAANSSSLSVCAKVEVDMIQQFICSKTERGLRGSCTSGLWSTPCSSGFPQYFRSDHLYTAPDKVLIDRLLYINPVSSQTARTDSG